ncbi:hypothetical protein E2562_036985 [Oryza meyeriana var. granulata]|uniref:Uncharacterized protein n=1 Tax=Oryza meyeriana var. granulata TaxID=110450 RepID=A0A6G1F1Z1_9ORYZ|nr:hypothetical protein E2562_036985 [Oryza meyeriana var. granulata]
MGEPAPPEPSEPNPSESSDATASDQISEEQEGSPDNLVEARDGPQRDDAGPRPSRVDYTRYKAMGMHRLRQVPEAD